MEQDSRVRPMSREENAAYRGVTLEESGAEPHEETGQSWGGSTYGGAPRGSVRYIRIGGAAPQRSFLTSLLWALGLGTLLALFIFVALPAIAMVIVGVFVLGAIISLVGRGRILSWVMRRLYGR
ncbi:peptidase M48 [Selenomonas sp. oral taxon 126]|uniref:peptidase M48 n=1 Tax=Selenomonas sp. oral taxon 126 TaxID=712528 RepID=UPI0008077505|nr:peptidase M48 [Selenomonas sp. oral taxon 126]ANR69564.1 peptidase M48 [Selenomonas sp. oral taxon 126]